MPDSNKKLNPDKPFEAEETCVVADLNNIASQGFWCVKMKIKCEESAWLR